MAEDVWGQQELLLLSPPDLQHPELLVKDVRRDTPLLFFIICMKTC